MTYKEAKFWNLNWGNEETWLLIFLAYLPICSIEKFQSISIITYWVFSVCTCISHHWLSSRYLHQLDLGYYKVITFFFLFFFNRECLNGKYQVGHYGTLHQFLQWNNVRRWRNPELHFRKELHFRPNQTNFGKWKQPDQ